MSTGIEAVKEVKNLLDEQRGIRITDVPRETLTWFLDFSNSDEFCCGANKQGHRGFCLKFLCDFYRGRIVDGSAIAEAKAEEALNQISELKAKPNEEKLITLLNGEKLKVN